MVTESETSTYVALGLTKKTIVKSRPADTKTDSRKSHAIVHILVFRNAFRDVLEEPTFIGHGG
jgi:hypothetical protein